MKYFVTSLSATKNIATMNWQTLILADQHVDEAYWDKAKLELSNEVSWVTQSELYQKLQRNDGLGSDIILSKPVSVLLEDIKFDFPKANVWVYE